MTFRTRLAFMVILLLLGCVFAAPFYQSAISSPAESDTSLPTLQIQRNAQQSVEQNMAETANSLTIDPVNFESVASSANLLTKPSTQTRSEHSRNALQRSVPDRGMALSVEPIPALEMPSIKRRESSSSSLKSIAIPQPRPFGASVNGEQANSAIKQTPAADMRSAPRATVRTNQPSIRAASLVGTNIGARFTRNIKAHDALAQSDDGRRTTLATDIAWDQQESMGSAHERPPSRAPQNIAPRPDRQFDSQPAMRRIDFGNNSLNDQQLNNHSLQGRSLSTSNQQKTEKRWHRIARFDTLNQLSKKYYGSPDFALAIFEANRHSLVSPAILPIGTELVIPNAADIQPKLRRVPPEAPPPGSREAPRFPTEFQHGWRGASDELERLNGL